MDIISLKFVLTVFISVVVYYLIDTKYRPLFLVLLSSAFIVSYSAWLCLYIIAFTGINYFLAIRIKQSKTALIYYRAGLLFNIAQIIVLKYASFALDPLLHIFNGSLTLTPVSRLIIPIGVSYFTLQAIGYLVNVKMGWENPEKSFIHFLLYLIFFPKFLSGPVERSNHFLPQVKRVHLFNEQQITDGSRMLVLGFFKKVVIANQLIPIIQSDYTHAGGATLWIIMLLQPAYLYFDFSGYTNIALGMARLMGFNLLPNFDRPFLAENITTFWKKFHMSLSLWFNDYIFKQISFKYRKWGISSSIVGLLVTWLLFGIWHGAGWNFMVLGLCQAVVVIFEFFTKKFRTRLFSKFPTPVRIWIGRSFTYLVYSVSLVFFFSPDLTSALHYLSRLTNMEGPMNIGPLSTIPISLLVSLPLFILWEVFQKDFSNQFTSVHSMIFGNGRFNLFIRWTVYSVILTMIYMVGTHAYQFVYANF